MEHLFLRVNRVEPLMALLVVAERRHDSLAAIALARALRKAQILRAVAFEMPAVGGVLEGRAYQVELRGRGGVLVLYHLAASWGSSEFQHEEQGLAFIDERTGAVTLLHYGGQHAGKARFRAKLPDYAAELKIRLRGAFPLEPLGLDWGPKVECGKRGLPRVRRERAKRERALDELQRISQELGLYD